MRNLNREDLINILYGAAILGTGGGGSLDEGIEMIDEALAAGKTFTLASFDEMDPDDIIGTPYACGAISPLTEEEKQILAEAGVAIPEETPAVEEVAAEAGYEEAYAPESEDGETNA